jgi:hypothetical protein
MNAHLPDVDDEMLTADYWIRRMYQTERETGRTENLYADREQDPNALRAAVRRTLSPSLTDLDELGRKWMTESLTETEFHRWNPKGTATPTLYDADGHVLSRAFWEDVLENARYGRQDLILQPGFSVRRADLRTWPTSAEVYQRPDDEWDRFQETALHTFEPVLVVAPSRDGRWLEVITQTYRGWVQAEDIALCSWDEFHHYSQPDHFAVVTARSAATLIPTADGQVTGPDVEFAACLPLTRPATVNADSVRSGPVSVFLPSRREDGRLCITEVCIADLNAIHIGYLPYSREHVLRSAFALFGEPYGWGDRDGRHDCSSFVMDVYRTVGIQLPRNAEDQERAWPHRIIFGEHATADRRLRSLERVQPGDPLYMPGHTMLFLGRVGQHAYVIHDFVGYVKKDGSDVRKVRVGQVAVSTLDIHVEDGRTYLEALTSALNLFQV